MMNYKILEINNVNYSRAAHYLYKFMLEQPLNFEKESS